MRSRFDDQLDQLNKELISMGALCEEAIGRSVRALRDGDRSEERRVGKECRSRWSPYH